MILFEKHPHSTKNDFKERNTETKGMMRLMTKSCSKQLHTSFRNGLKDFSFGEKNGKFLGKCTILNEEKTRKLVAI